jgi:hypothetical protein
MKVARTVYRGRRRSNALLLPEYRQSGIYARAGVDLDRFTMARWIGGRNALLLPLGEALRRYVLATGKVHADDTPMPVLAPGNGKPEPAGSRSTYKTTVIRDRHWHQRYGSPTRQIDRARAFGSSRSASLACCW